MEKEINNLKEVGKINKLKAKRNFLEKFYLNDMLFKTSFVSLILTSVITVIMSAMFLIPAMATLFSLDALLLVLTGYSVSERYENKILDKMGALDKEISDSKEKLGIVDEKIADNTLQTEDHKCLLREMMKLTKRENKNILSRKNKEEQEVVVASNVTDDGISSND